jgi:DNA-binding CsgD family transcriptional regulator
LLGAVLPLRGIAPSHPRRHHSPRDRENYWAEEQPDDPVGDCAPMITGIGVVRPRASFTDRVADTLMRQLRLRQHGPCSKLSNREREVVALVAEGYSNKEIAEELRIHQATVEYHRSSAIRKLQLSSPASSAGLVRYAVRNKLVEA